MTNLIILVCGINALTFWQKDLFLWFLASGVNEAFGFYYASNNTVGSAAWVTGICVVALGGFCVMRAVMLLAARGTKRRKI